MTYFCPNCWNELKVEDNSCPFCGFLLTDWNKLSYREKLRRAIFHKERSTAFRAVWLLGLLRDEGSVDDLIRLCEENSEPALTLEALTALSRIGNRDAILFLEKTCQADHLRFSERAKQLLEGLKHGVY